MTSFDRAQGTLRSLLTLVALAALLPTSDSLLAQAPTKRSVTHDDYDRWTSIRATKYSRDGKWMAYSISPRIGDGMLYIREVDGDKVYEFARGTSVTFSNDNQFALFKIAKSYEDERKKKLEKLHAEEEEGEEVEEEETEGLPPDIKAALAERGMPETMAKQVTLALLAFLSMIFESERFSHGYL